MALALTHLERLRLQAQALLSPAFLSRIAQELGLEWRQTPLALPNLVALFARQVLQGNCSIPELLRQAGVCVTPEAYCIARSHLPLELLQYLLEHLAQRVGVPLRQDAASLWKGHRLWHIDGSSFSMPDTPALQERFGQQGAQQPGCGFPTAHLLCLFDGATGLIQDVIVSPLRTHDMAHAAALDAQLQPGDLLIGDRAFENYVHLALARQRKIELLVPIHQKRHLDLRRRHPRPGKGHQRDARVLERYGPRDCLVLLHKPATRPDWIAQEDFKALPETIQVRVIRRQVTLPGGKRRMLTLVTTLLDAKRYPAKALFRLLKARWNVEVNLRHLKTTMKMDVLRSKSPEGIEKELWMFLIVYNAVRVVMLDAAARQHVAPDRISFADALYWVRYGDLSESPPPLQIVPHRPDRVEPRVLKRRRHGYKLMNKPRPQLRKALLSRK